MLGERIHRARVGAGLSLRALADRADVSQTTISKFEKALLTPSSPMLLALARACDVKVEYFFRPDSVELGQPEYRKRSRLGKKALARIQANVMDQAERYLQLLSLFPRPPILEWKVPDGLPTQICSYEQLEECATGLRQAWSLGLNPLPDLIGTLEEHGILVLVTPVDDKGRFDGLAATIDGLPLVVVGESWPGDRQRFTLAHELGHLVLHNGLSSDLDEEKACNRFAGAFIAPKEAVLAELGSRRTHLEPRELYTLKQSYGLSMAGWLFRAADNAIITESQKMRLYKQFSMRGWRKTEPGSQVPSEHPHQFEKLVFHALAEDYIGESKAAELLSERRSEFRARRWMEQTGAAAHQ